MSLRIIFLAGIHGVGKSHLTKYLRNKYNITTFSASALIKAEKNTHTDSLKRVLEPNENQEHLINAIRRLNIKQNVIILDGHFVLLTSNGFFEVPFRTFKSLPIDTILLKVIDERIIHDRLLQRDGYAPEIDILKALQTREIERAKKVSLLLKARLITVDLENYEDIDFKLELNIGSNEWH